jgi:hypothetical protein
LNGITFGAACNPKVWLTSGLAKISVNHVEFSAGTHLWFAAQPAKSAQMRHAAAANANTV